MAKMPEAQTDAAKIYRATIVTNRGTIVMDLDPQLAPNTVNNFVGLARDGYYDNLTFHRVVPEFVSVRAERSAGSRGGFYHLLYSAGDAAVCRAGGRTCDA